MTNLEQLFADGGGGGSAAGQSSLPMRVNRKKSASKSGGDVAFDSSLSSLATKTFKSNDDEENEDENDENYSNIRFDDSIYERVENEPVWDVAVGAGKKNELLPLSELGQFDSLSGHVGQDISPLSEICPAVTAAVNSNNVSTSSLPLNQSKCYYNKIFKV